MTDHHHIPPRNDPADKRMYPEVTDGSEASLLPWEVHAQRDGHWHLHSRDGRPLAVFGREDDARFVAVIVDKLSRRDPTPLIEEYRVTHRPWLVRPEQDGEIGLGFHVYSESVHHVCVGSFRTLADAKAALTFVNALDLLDHDKALRQRTEPRTN